MSRAVIGIGTNMGDRGKNIKDALSALGLLPRTRVVKTSSVYETEPWGFKEQPNFYNICAEIDTSFSPHALLGALLGIEAAFGRVRNFKNGPRIIDLDLLLFEDEAIATGELTVPHPKIRERAFVLYPLEELYPDAHFLSYDFSESLKKADKKSILGVYQVVK
jgi:2-amino-4-hydroxy-6-hydroxymethyldihydropteridine diphosphokinase